jgi:hypothetical protein
VAINWDWEFQMLPAKNYRFFIFQGDPVVAVGAAAGIRW